MKALVIDDSRAVRMVIKKILAGIGVEAVEAEDGKDALAKLQATGDIGVCLVDWNMPVMNGYDFVCEVRSNPAYENVKLMMVTTENESGQILKALNAGVDEYVMKPFTDDVISEKLSIMGLI